MPVGHRNLKQWLFETDDVVLSIGRAYGTYLKRKGMANIAFGKDCRVSSPRIHDAVLKGILSSGINVIDIGLSTTPCLYFSIHDLQTGGGLMITGSHNPPDQNGLKLCIGTSSLHGSEIQKLKEMIERGDYDSGLGTVSEKPMISDYANYINNIFKFKRQLKVAVDCGNGMVGMIAPDLFRRFGHEVTELYSNLDGRFPNHPADPSDPKNIQDLIRCVREQKADVGIAFDGDGDRLGVVDEQGNYIFNDRLMVLFARNVLQSNPGATIIGDVKCSNVFFREIEKAGGKAIMWKTGHSLIKAKMKEENALLAGEVSGHVFFKHRWLGFDSGLYAACRLLEILDQSQQSLSGMLSTLPKTLTTPEMRVECPDDKKFQIVSQAVDYFKKNGYRVIDIDGARVEFDDGWGLVRASNTQPVLVMRFEAQTENRLNEIRNLIEGKVKELSR